MKLFIRSCFLIASLFLGISSFAQSNLERKVYPGLLEKLQNGGNHEMIIYLKKQADLSASRYLSTKAEKGQFVWNELNKVANQTQTNVLNLLEDNQVYFHRYVIINAVYAVADLEIARKLADLTEVSNIYANPSSPLDGPVMQTQIAARDTNLLNWGLDMIEAPRVWKQGYTGEGVVIGGQDTGYDWDHFLLKVKYRGYRGINDPADHNYNWHDAIHEISPLASDSTNPCGLSAMEPCDDNNHGTHTMGTMVGSSGDDYYGVAPDARWIGCRNMERGNGSPATYMECFEWFLAPTDLNDENPDPDKAPHVINN
ncbi:MAG: S8 family serine peptidase, partial [Saprospiraceae bacterium]